MMRVIAALCCMGLIFIGMGCGALPIVPLAETEPIKAMLAQTDTVPISGRTMVAYIDPSGLPDVFDSVHPNIELAWIPTYDIEGETQELTNIMDKLGIFEEVLKSKLLPEESSRDAAIREAWQRGFDFVLYPELKEYRVYFAGHTGSHVGNMFLWFLLWVPSWFVHDEIYGAAADVELALIDVYSREDVVRKVYSGSTEHRLNSFQRGWQFFGIWRSPGSLGADNWGKIASSLMPHALNQLNTALLGDFKQGIVKTIAERATFRRAVAKTIVLAIGLNQHTDTRISPVPYASSDAEHFFNILKQGGKAREGYSQLLVDGMAGKQDILDNLTALCSRARDTDAIVLYYSGYGAALNTEDGSIIPALIPYDAQQDSLLTTCVPLTDIAAILNASAAGEIAVILDTSFSGSVAGKTLRKEGAMTAETVSAILGERVAVFCAGGPGEAANIFSELRGSLFTYYLIEAIESGKGDANADSLHTMKEAFLYAGDRVKATSQFRGRTQRPVWMGDADAHIILQGSDKAAAIEAVMTQLGADSVEEVELD